MTWSASRNVAWKTTIPGRGHSSPILADDAVYVTTAYQRVQSAAARNVAAYSILALAVLSAMLGVGAAIQSLHAKRNRGGAVLQHVRYLLFHQVLLGILITVLYGRRLLNPENDGLRSWAVAVVAMLSCLVLISLCIPARSRQQTIVGGLSFAITAGAWLSLSDRRLLFALGSTRGALATSISILPALFGAAVLLAHRVSLRRQSSEVRGEGRNEGARLVLWHYMITGAIGYVAALVPFFFLLYRAADYQIPDRYIWNDRIGTDVHWSWIAVGSILFFVASLWQYWRSAGGPRGRKPSMQACFCIAVVCLGIAFSVGGRFNRTAKESVRAITCLDSGTGEIRWSCEGLQGQTYARGRTLTDATPTPVTDGERVYAYFGADGLMCVDTMGQLLWKKVGARFSTHFGVGTSPVLKDNTLVVVNDVEKPSGIASSITAYDGASGEVLWRRERKSHDRFAAYSTPLIRSWNGKQTIIVHGWFDIRAYDLMTGAELWAYPMAHKAEHLVASPVCDDERLYVTGARSVTALDLSKVGTDSDPVVWSTPIAGEKSSTPVVVDGLLFLVTEIGKVFCLDAQTGQIHWGERLKGRFYASAIATGDRILLTNEAGRTTVVAVAREFQPLAMNDLDSSVYASAAPAGNHLFIRNTEYVYCLQDKSEVNDDSR